MYVTATVCFTTNARLFFYQLFIFQMTMMFDASESIESTEKGSAPQCSGPAETELGPEVVFQFLWRFRLKAPSWLGKAWCYYWSSFRKRPSLSQGTNNTAAKCTVPCESTFCTLSETMQNRSFCSVFKENKRKLKDAFGKLYENSRHKVLIFNSQVSGGDYCMNFLPKLLTMLYNICTFRCSSTISCTDDKAAVHDTDSS